MHHTAYRASKIKALLKKTPPNNIFWKPATLIQRVTTQPHIQKWLTIQGSLTAQLRTLDPEIKVHILSEKLERPLINESQALNISPYELTWVRCVLLKGHKEDWIYARTVIPSFSDTHPWSTLQTLGNKPLGDLLFQTHNIQRTPFNFSRQPLSYWPYLPTYLSTMSRIQTGYARRSIFYQHHSPLLLTEVFLPPFLHDKSKIPGQPHS